MWPSISTGEESPRSEVLINIDPISNYAAIRQGDFKYVIGSSKSGEEWYGDTGREENYQAEGYSPDYNVENILMSKAGAAISNVITKNLTADEIYNLRNQATLECGVSEEDRVSKKIV